MKRNNLILALVVLALSACSSYGKKEFECNAPLGSTCMSAREIYNNTNGGQQIFSKGQQQEKSNSRDGKKSALSPPKKIKDSVVDTFVAPQLPDSPIPILTPPVVMRVKVYSYEDASSGVLYAPGFAFVEVTPRRWTVGKPQSDVPNGKHSTPLEADTSSKKQP